MDPTLGWDKSFVSPSCKKITTATLEDRATFWKSTSSTARDSPAHVNMKMTPAGVAEQSNRSIQSAAERNDLILNANVAEPRCGVCSQSIDIWSKCRHPYFLLWNFSPNEITLLQTFFFCVQ